MHTSAIVGIGATPYYRRGASLPQTPRDMACDAIMAAAADAGIPVTAIDGFAYFSNYGGGIETGGLMEALGIPEVGFSATTTGGGGGSAGAIGLAQAAIVNGDSRYVAVVQSLQQAKNRLGAAFARMPPTPENSFYRSAGVAAPGQFAAFIARRHIHKFGTRREAFAEVAISTRQNAVTNPAALMRDPLTLDDYFASPMLADPLCKLDFCLESDGAVAILLARADEARDMAQKPVYVAAAKHGGDRDWGRGFMWGNMPDESFSSSGMRSIARRLYAAAGMGPEDIDVALLYDHFTAFVVMQLEDFGFCPIGEGGPFVEQGAIRLAGGSIPVNPHGGNLSEAYIIGITHVAEAVRQIRGTAANQVKDAATALVTGGPGPMPLSALLLTA
ncbi:thiolase C-terminal domain-containing protein [Novosphingobium album (ex Liu et al. 2023)]|uniref:Thiolase n=1 Tax=Novosphingobium album (ex Liu et al. 2023) TaxID=3031130 RepID=A0ABT5WUM0_9SPHN|nr:thiolase [Novosphingobium album (ex Liu et al. 2023)]MDE8653567.1 thiolase [Novosphingobium album (ex Liu et al. 2023)]